MPRQEFKSQFNNTPIYGEITRPKEIRGVIVLVHGFGEHLGRYHKHIIPLLANSSLAVVAYDNIGHGKSGGKRGHCPNYNALLDILDRIIEKAKSSFPGKPLFLYGHSMGGNLVLNYAIRRQTDVTGIIATSPYLKLAFNPPRWKMILGKVMMRIMPSMTLPSGLDPDGISRIPEEASAYAHDDLVHDKVSPMFSFPIMDAGEWAIANADRLDIDTLLLHGTGDPIIDHKATMAFHEKATKTTLKLFEGGYHELHNDLVKEEMMAAIQNWLQLQH
ncbi:MAG: lysophospholipase [Bacteroidota bacterium]